MFPAVLRLMRPGDWAKNAFVLVPLVFIAIEEVRKLGLRVVRHRRGAPQDAAAALTAG